MAATLLLAGGCSSPDSSRGSADSSASEQAATMPNLGPSMLDVRTETTIQAMEQEYIAAKNSQPTRQHEAEAKAAKRKAEAEKQEAAKAAEKKDPETE